MNGQQTDFFSGPRDQKLTDRQRLFVGTSGYIFPDWRGTFYPEKLPQTRWLDYYVGQFDTVEINATYYRLPPLSTFESMARRSPEGYPFWVKVPGELTHRGGDVSDWMRLFNEATQPLRESNKLAGTLAQFPFSFRPSVASFDRLAKLKELSGDCNIAMEFRHQAWQADAPIEFLQENQITYVIPDLPKLANLPSSEAVVTSGTAYIRLHGRNEKTWNDPAAGDRYDYNYSSSELGEWVPKISKLAEKAEQSFVFFNNCHMGQAVKNARMLRALLENEFGGVRNN